MIKKIKERFSRNKKQPEDDKPKRLADVADRHLGAMVKTWNIAHITKTSLILFGLIMVVFMSWSERNMASLRGDHVAQIVINGDYTDTKMGTGYTVAKSFREAVEDPKSKAIMFVVNSGGGSPVAGEQLFRAVKAYTDSAPVDKRKPVYVSVRSMCASSCYYSIAAADVIVANRTSLIGSIGVRMSTMNFKELADKLGVEQRTLTSGPHKAMLDPFTEISAEEEAMVKQEIIEPLFKLFVNDVVTGRKGKLDPNNELLFSGFIWPGEKAMSLGFVDRLGTVIEVEDELMSQTGAKHVKVVNEPSFSLTQMLQSATEAVITKLAQMKINAEF